MKPNLGCATTRELLEELAARMEVSHDIDEYPEITFGVAVGARRILETLPGSLLNYRTVNQ